VSDDTTAAVVLTAIEFYEYRTLTPGRVRLTSPRQTISSGDQNDSKTNPTTTRVSSSDDVPQKVSPSNVSLKISPAMKCTLDDFLVCFPSHINNLDNGAALLNSNGGEEFTLASHQNALALISSSEGYKQHKHIDIISYERNRSDSGSGMSSDRLSALQQACNQGQATPSPRSGGPVWKKPHNQIPLEKIMVQVQFKNLKHGSVVDNDYYTTLLPSKLPPSSWGAKAIFETDAAQSRGNVSYTDILSPPSVSPLFSTSLRRLLALYVCGKSSRLVQQLASCRLLDFIIKAILFVLDPIALFELF
jgi:hypothetical protein